MKNLDTLVPADVEKELLEAEIEVIQTANLILPSGRLTKDGGERFIFRRVQYAWEVTGDLPLEIALELYGDPSAGDIWVDGHAGRKSPEEWAEPDYSQMGEMGLLGKGLGVNDLVRVARSHNLQLFVRNYTINTQKGLNLFTAMLVKHGLVDRPIK